MMKKKSGNEHKQRCPTRNEIGQDPVAKAIDLPTGDIVGVADNYQDNGYGTKILKRSQMHTLSLTRLAAVAVPKSTPHTPEQNARSTHLHALHPASCRGGPGLARNLL